MQKCKLINQIIHKDNTLIPFNSVPGRDKISKHLCNFTHSGRLKENSLGSRWMKWGYKNEHKENWWATISKKSTLFPPFGTLLLMQPHLGESSYQQSYSFFQKMKEGCTNFFTHFFYYFFFFLECRQKKANMCVHILERSYIAQVMKC